MMSDHVCCGCHEREAQAEIGRLSAEVERLNQTLDDVFTEEGCPRCGRGVSASCIGCEAKASRERAEAAEAKVAEWQDMAYRERDRADEHDSARQSEKERADYAEAKVRELEAKLAETEKDAVAFKRVLDKTLAELATAREEHQGCDMLILGHIDSEAAARERERVLRETLDKFASDLEAAKIDGIRLLGEELRNRLRAALRSSEEPAAKPLPLALGHPYEHCDFTGTCGHQQAVAFLASPTANRSTTCGRSQKDHQS